MESERLCSVSSVRLEGRVPFHGEICRTRKFPESRELGDAGERLLRVLLTNRPKQDGNGLFGL